MRETKILWLALSFCLVGGTSFGQSLPEKEPIPAEQKAEPMVTAIEVSGNRIVSLAKITSKIKTRVNSVYQPAIASDDVKRLYALGFFERVWVEKEKTEQGIKVIFKVVEKPLLKEVVFKGNRRVHKSTLEKAIELKKGTAIDERVIKTAADKIKELYVKRGYPQVEVETKLDRSEPDNEAVLTITVIEHQRNRIKTMDIAGNEFFKEKRLLSLIKTRKKWLFFSGVLKEELLKDDLKRLEDFYKAAGFEDVKVTYAYSFNPAGMINVLFTVVEGPRYFTGRVALQGPAHLKEDEVRKVLTMREGGVFSNRQLKEDVVNIQTLYFNKGYIFAQVVPQSALNKDTGKVDVVYKITENDPAYVNLIDIRGNLHTKDKVIRRELKLKPGERFDGEKLRKSKDRLERLGFFEEIRFDTEPGTRPNWENLIIDVKEAKTGTFSFGGGYSSVDQFVGFVEVRQRNFDYKNFPSFVGGGQDVSLEASFGSITQNYELSFTNPWIFDRPVSFGFDAYKREHERETDVGYGYNESITGGDIRLGRDFGDLLKGTIAYRVEQVNISDVDPTATNDLKQEEGKAVINSLELGGTYDTRDNVFFPLKGAYLTASNKIAGLGGDKNFLQVSFRESVYFPMMNKSVLELRLREGFSYPYGDTDILPIYERFFAGGAYTIRGYHERKIGPIDPATNDPLGGESMFVANLEYTYPLIDFLKVAAFFDSGNVWEKSSDFGSGGFKSSIGLGLRVKTPFGPISLDYGIPLNKEPGEPDKGGGRFHFSVSRGF